MQQEIYKLKFPVKLENGTSLEQITISRPKGKHLRLMPDAAFSGEPTSPVLYFPMLALMVGVDVSVFDEIDVTDINEVVTILMRFLTSSLATGKN